MPPLKLMKFGLSGVNVDKDPISLGDEELLQAQNATTEVTAGRAALVNREGLTPFNTEDTAGVVVGGIGVPLPDLSLSGTHFFYIGRGPLA